MSLVEVDMWPEPTWFAPLVESRMKAAGGVGSAPALAPP